MDPNSPYKHECEILLYLFNHKKIYREFFKKIEKVDDYKYKENALKNLINNNIVRKTSSKDGSLYEFHSPKIRLAIQICEKENQNKLKGKTNE